jgi:DNA-cytosine methyltransferase
MNVLSLFDGCSCGQQALERTNIKVNNYFASEIDKYAIKVTMANYPNTIQLGSVVNVDGYSLPKIDMLIGGSPCQSFSFAGKRKGMATKCETEITTLEQYLELKSEGFEFEGQSYLFWEYMRLLNEVKPTYFLLENVMMGEKWEKILTKAIGVNPIEINSSLLSAQNRRRLYWTNIGMQPRGFFGDLESVIKQPKDKGILLKDILESDVDEKYFLSEKIIAGFEKHKQRHDEKQTGFGFKPKDENDKGNCLRANAAICATDNMIKVHNLQKRSADRPSIQKNKNAGETGHLSRQDGKAYCLDSGNTQAVEIKIDEFDESIMTFEQKEGVFEKGNRVFDEKGIFPTLTTMSENDRILNNSRIRRLTPIECERLQTVKDNYTNHVSDSQRYKMLGNGWTVDVIAHIFLYIE